MDDMVLACGLGLLFGVILFLILALTGYIDKWSNNIDEWRHSKQTPPKH